MAKRILRPGPLSRTERRGGQGRGAGAAEGAVDNSRGAGLCTLCHSASAVCGAPAALGRCSLPLLAGLPCSRRRLPFAVLRPSTQANRGAAYRGHAAILCRCARVKVRRSSPCPTASPQRTKWRLRLRRESRRIGPRAQTASKSERCALSTSLCSVLSSSRCTCHLWVVRWPSFRLSVTPLPPGHCPPARCCVRG